MSEPITQKDVKKLIIIQTVDIERGVDYDIYLNDIEFTRTHSFITKKHTPLEGTHKGEIIIKDLSTWMWMPDDINDNDLVIINPDSICITVNKINDINVDSKTGEIYIIYITEMTEIVNESDEDE